MIAVVIKEVVVGILGVLIVVGVVKSLRITMGQGELLRRYYLYLVYWWIKWWRKKDRSKRMWLKPLGLCNKCMSPYIALPICLLLMIKFNVTLTLFLVIPFSIIILNE